MKPNEINKAIAEALGWRFTAPPVGGASFNNWQRPDGTYTAKCPDYCSNLNAMHEAEKSLKDSGSREKYSQRRHYENLLITLAPRLVYATAAQRAKAFVQVIETRNL